VSGSHAARVAAGLGANVVVMDISLDVLRRLAETMPANVTTVYCDPHAVERHAVNADLIVGAVLVPGRRAPVLIPRTLLPRMKPGAVMVDISIDQGGCFETSRPTTHSQPTYVVDGVVHYCVTNMPGAVGRTSTQALCSATLPYVRELAGLGVDAFVARDAGHRAALNLLDGKIVNPAVASAFTGMP
jgi:alanine dehydrogenase